MLAVFQSLLALFSVDQHSPYPFEEEGRVDKVVEPGKIWQIWHQATFWFARCRGKADFRPGDWVKVVDRQGIVLFIEPLSPDDPEPLE